LKNTIKEIENRNKKRHIRAPPGVQFGIFPCAVYHIEGNVFMEGKKWTHGVKKNG
jgi:hypothetical protein